MPRGRKSTIVADCRADRLIIERASVEGVVATTRDAGGVARARPRSARRSSSYARGGIENAGAARAIRRLAAAARTQSLSPPHDGGGRRLRRSHRGLARTAADDHVRAVRARRRRLRLSPRGGADASGCSRSRRRGRTRERIAAHAASAHVASMIALTRDARGGRVRARARRRVRSTTSREVRTGAVSARHRGRGACSLAAGADEVHTLHARVRCSRSRASPADIDAFYQRIVAEPVGGELVDAVQRAPDGTCRMGATGRRRCATSRRGVRRVGTLRRGRERVPGVERGEPDDHGDGAWRSAWRTPSRIAGELRSAVLPFDPLSVAAVHDGAPPAFVLQIPVHRPGQPVRSVSPGSNPSATRSSRVDGVSPVVARSVAHVGDQLRAARPCRGQSGKRSRNEAVRRTAVDQSQLIYDMHVLMFRSPADVERAAGDVRAQIRSIATQ